jgi:hypothetical protein
MIYMCVHSCMNLYNHFYKYYPAMRLRDDPFGDPYDSRAILTNKLTLEVSLS